jgi:hypothetical protein
MPPALIENVSDELGRLLPFLFALARLLCELDASLRLRERGLDVLHRVAFVIILLLREELFLAVLNCAGLCSSRALRKMG